MLLALVCCIAAQAQEADYQPLVREGVRWVNIERFITVDSLTVTDTAEFVSFKTYTRFNALEIRGDTLLNGVGYKKLYRTFVKGDPIIDTSTGEHLSTTHLIYSSTTPAAYLREDGGRVFCIIRNWANPSLNDEFLLYDFSNGNEATLYNPYDHHEECWTFMLEEQTTLGGASVRTYARDFLEYIQGMIPYLVEGVGFVSQTEGDLIDQIWDYWDRMDWMPCQYGLCYVETTQGDILYRGPNYHFFSSDVTGDGKVDIADVNEAINAMLGKSAAAADVNGDSKVDIADVNAVINAMLDK